MLSSIQLIYVFWGVFLFINGVTYFLYAVDKVRAKKKSRRIKERRLLFLTLFFGGFGAFIGMYKHRHKTQKKKFRFVVTIGVVIASITIIHLIEGITVGRMIQFKNVTFYSEFWPEHLNGYTVGFMSDFHQISEEDMMKVANELNERSLDLLLLGGDFADNQHKSDHFITTLDVISSIQTTDGIFGVEGNHDTYAYLFPAMLKRNITPLNNTGQLIRNGFFLGGVQDLRLRQPDIHQATSKANPDDFILLLTHNPDVAMWEDAQHLNLVLAGHTHGGQINFFGFPIYLAIGNVSTYGTRFSHGFNDANHDLPVFTTRGVGSYYNWPRIFARPEVIVLTMHHEK